MKGLSSIAIAGQTVYKLDRITKTWVIKLSLWRVSIMVAYTVWYNDSPKDNNYFCINRDWPDINLWDQIPVHCWGYCYIVLPPDIESIKPDGTKKFFQ